MPEPIAGGAGLTAGPRPDATPRPDDHARARPSPGTHRRAWIDARNGVAGDMLLGALLDAGAGLTEVQRAVDAVIPGTTELTTSVVHRAGMRATRLDVRTLVEDHPHRAWTEVRRLIHDADLAESIRERALAVFGQLADAEGRAHGIDPEEVHFHEVGAWDSIADVVGVCAALDQLGVVEVSGGPVALGSGSVRTAHGQIPVPVPAVLELSAGWRVLGGGEGELATPTGMALVVALSTLCEDLPELTIEASGVGAGTRDPQDRPNVVRVVLGVAAAAADRPGPDPREPVPAEGDDHLEQVVLLETNADDLDPRVWPGVLAALVEAGAADALGQGRGVGRESRRVRSAPTWPTTSSSRWASPARSAPRAGRWRW